MDCFPFHGRRAQGKKMCVSVAKEIAASILTVYISRIIPSWWLHFYGQNYNQWFHLGVTRVWVLSQHILQSICFFFSYRSKKNVIAVSIWQIKIANEWGCENVQYVYPGCVHAAHSVSLEYRAPGQGISVWEKWDKKNNNNTWPSNTLKPFYFPCIKSSITLNQKLWICL